MNNQDILTRINAAMALLPKDEQHAFPGSCYAELSSLARDLAAQIRLDIARQAGHGNAAKIIRAFLKVAAKDMRESLRYPWIDAQGRECYCDGFRAFRLNNPLRLVDRPDSAGKPIDLTRIYPDSLAGWKELPMPTIAEIKAHIALQVANGVKRGDVVWYFGQGKPAVNAHYLLDAAQVFPDADRIFWLELHKPLVIGGKDGDGLILPIRVADNVQPAPASEDERKAVEAYDAKRRAAIEADRQEYKAEQGKRDAIRQAHDDEEQANKDMNYAAARIETLQRAVNNNTTNEALREGQLDALKNAQREFALAALRRHAARLAYDPDTSMQPENLEVLVMMLYGIDAA